MSSLLRFGLPAALLALAGSVHPAFAQVPQDFSTNVVNPFYTNVANITTSTDSNSPVFHRFGVSPGTVTGPPTGLSGAGTAVAYATAGFTAPQDATYRITTTINSGFVSPAASLSGTDNFVQGIYVPDSTGATPTFDPTNPLVNAELIYSQPFSGASYAVGLAGGTAYTFVNTGYYNSTLTGSRLSTGTVTTAIDQYNVGSTMTIPQASTLAPNTVSQTLNISGSGAISSFNSFDIVGLNQIALGGLTATLSHDGVSVNVFNQVGANAGNYFQGSTANFDGENYYFTDSGADLAAAAAAQEPPLGSFADPGSVAGGIGNPYKSLGSLSAFNGMDVNGAWTLSLTDSDQGNDGSFLGFGFNATAPVPEASSIVSLSLLLALGLGGLVVTRRRAAASSY